MSLDQLSRRDLLCHGTVGVLALSIGTRIARSQEAPANPVGSVDLIARQAVPFNGEPPLNKLVENWITPVNSFFVRSHGNVPEIESKDLTLTIDGIVDKPLTFTLAELTERFPKATATLTLTCAGNRRGEFAAIKKVGGVQWDAGAIGNAEWQGIRLADVLNFAGVKAEAKHVWFEGRDRVTEKNVTFPFGGSIPIEKARATTVTGVSLLATEMNGKPLTPSHGFPLRTLVPGYIGARSVKWLHKITVADRPSPNHFVADVYKLVPEDNAELIAKTSPIYEFTLNSAICVPPADTVASSDRIAVKGFALTNGTTGRSVQQIDVSADDGQSWTQAKVTSPVRDYCWVLWSADVPVTERTTGLVVRATDSSGEVQPQECQWNYKGYQFNGWHKVNLKRM
jgi:sulfite oxidase